MISIAAERDEGAEPGAERFQVGGDQDLGLQAQLDLGHVTSGRLTCVAKQPDPAAELRQRDRSGVPALTVAGAGGQPARRRLPEPERWVRPLHWLRRADGVGHLPGAAAKCHATVLGPEPRDQLGRLDQVLDAILHVVTPGQAVVDVLAALVAAVEEM